MIGKSLGLIVNPVAGLGGRVGLKGSDGLAIQQLARDRGAVPVAHHRAARALEPLAGLARGLELVTCPAAMGEDVARACGFNPTVIGSVQSELTTPEDTRRAAKEMATLGVDLILFAGGDGTARDMYSAVGTSVPTLGIPAGVKMHSAVYAINPVRAGHLAASYLKGDLTTLREVEVMDLDEDAYRQGNVSPRLYGHLRVPFLRQAVQARKAPSGLSEGAAMDAIALDIIEGMKDGVPYIVGPGTTTRPILTHLGLEKTLIGVDVVQNRHLVASDADESKLLALVRGRSGVIIVTPVGGQGCIFGRGNQQISPEVIRQVERKNLVIVSTVQKIVSLGGRPLLVDTGDSALDQYLTGYMKVTTGYHERIVYRVST